MEDLQKSLVRGSDLKTEIRRRAAIRHLSPLGTALLIDTEHYGLV